MVALRLYWPSNRPLPYRARSGASAIHARSAPMTDSGDTRPTSRFSWLRDILRRGPFGRRVWGTRRDLDAATRRVQIDIIRRELGRNVAVAPTRDGSVSYLFHPDRALVLASHVDEVEGFFAENSGTYRGTGSYERLIDGELVLYTFPPRSDS